jgi:hypothetical protein
MLLNLVKMRYLDLPIYLEVGQIVSGYTLETGVNLSGQFSPETLRGDTFAGAGVSGTFTDRPTITYTPLTGEKFLAGLLTPIHPTKIFSLVQSGYAADFILELSLDSLNGFRNRPVALGARHSVDPEFFQIVALLRNLQDAGALGLRMDPPANGTQPATLFFQTDRLAPEARAGLAQLRELLGLATDQPACRLVQSPLRGGVGELSVGTRSLWQVMTAMSLGVEIPPRHQERKLTPPIAGSDSLLRVHSGPKPPADAFVTVAYSGEWFWIASDDWKSKRTFTSLLFLFTLADTSGTGALPTITIPAQ